MALDIYDELQKLLQALQKSIDRLQARMMEKPEGQGEGRCSGSRI